MSEIIFLSDVVLSFPHLIEPHASPMNPSAPKKYSADFIMPTTHPGVQQFMQNYAALAQEKWKENANTIMQMIQSDRKLRCYGAGDEKVDKKTFKPYKGYAGNFSISANRAEAPQIIQPDGKPVDAGNTMLYQALTRKMYGGCHVNAAIRPWLQDNQFGRGVRCDLVAVQFFKDGEAFGESEPDVSGMFGAVAAPAGGAMPAGMPAFLMPQ